MTATVIALRSAASFLYTSSREVCSEWHRQLHYPESQTTLGRLESGISDRLRSRMQREWDKISGLLKSQPNFSERDNLQHFKRKWEYMCIYAEVGYARGYTGLQYFTFMRPDDKVFISEGFPLKASDEATESWPRGVITIADIVSSQSVP
ncbi:hypothetical protein NEOLEDRAFT_1150774 [Neolentinus lepideus HHB14362 ss-1]|uniref:Uncharacterized protein n=1 Tax=Neolentinus lepideus HHB14362 ss-1 TaxID=1314782 RepID=A0A165PP85_9AGAM|nr:hypothetical protein NEOLEDRAFT_1150774 [Neolentinus lepideus HHB14362 ss-1]